MTPILPENIRRCMPKEDRKALDTPTMPESLAKAGAKREKQLQERCMVLLRLHGVLRPNRSRMDKRKTDMVGWPDIVFCFRGRPVAWECKLPSEKLTPDQVVVADEMVTDGWTYQVIQSEEDARGFLFQMENDSI